MTTQKEALRIALEALENHIEDPRTSNLIEKLIAAIKEALAQEQEPVAWITPDGEGFRIRFSPPVNDVPLGWDALYTTPPQRKPLSDEQIGEIGRKYEKFDNQGNEFFARWGFARAIEAAHNIF